MNCKNILIVLTYIYLMMYVINKSSKMTKGVVTLVAIFLIFFRVEGFMSSFDGMNLTDPIKTIQLINPTRKLAALLGTGYVPLNDHLANDQKDKMFLFKDNLCSPSCCPSTYTCDSGCVCTTEQQEKISRQRFGNNPKPSEDISV